MASFLSTLFGFIGGEKGLAAPARPMVLPAPRSRLESVRPVLAEMLRMLSQPPQTGVLPPPRVLEKLPPSQIPVIVEDEQDFLEPTEPKTQQDALSSYDAKTQQWLRSGEWLYVMSSNVDALRYLWPERNLQVTYLNGSTYEYYEVEPEVAVDFTYALSPGRYRWHVLGDPRWGTVRYNYALISGATVKGRPKPRVAREVPTGLLNTIKGKRRK